jgi:menaquinol-cytochrome c reductase iron-sulfur subunit
MNINRRTFLKKGKVSFASLITLSMLPIGLTACGKQDGINTNTLVKLGPLSNLQKGKFPKKINYEGKVKNGLFTQERKGFVYVAKNKRNNELLFMSPLCTHLECTTTLAEEEMKQQGVTFYCPCHRGAFDDLGNNIGGPPDRPLDTYKTQVINGDVYLEILDPIKRKS